MLFLSLKLASVLSYYAFPSLVVVGSRRDLVDLALNHFRGRGVGDLEGNLNRSCSHKVVVARAGRKKLWWHQELEEKWWLPDTLVAHL